MKKILFPLFTILLLTACKKEDISNCDNQDPRLPASKAWSGMVSQDNYSDYGISVTFTCGFESANVAYSGLCGATWTLKSKNGNTYVYHEDVDSNRCVDDCTVTIEFLDNNTLKYQDVCLNYGVSAHGTLFPQ